MNAPFRITQFLAGTALLLSLLAPKAVKADEKGGLLVDVQKVSKFRNENVNTTGFGTREVDRTMALKVDIRNQAMKEMPAATVDYVILIHRWGNETGSVERYEGSQPLAAIPPLKGTNQLLGEFHIGGHMHGTSDRHVDKVVGWKVSVTRDGQKLDFVSGGTFDRLNQQAVKGS